METFLVLLLILILVLICVILNYISELKYKLDDLRRQIGAEKRASAPLEPRSPVPEESPAHGSDLTGEHSAVCREPAPEPVRPRLPIMPAAVPEPEPAAPETAAMPGPQPAEKKKPSETAVRPPRKERRKTDYEKYIGENLFGKIGIFVLILGVGFFVKYAIDNDWLEEGMRTALGFACGAVLLGTAARLRNKYRSFSSLLAGGAFAVFYVTIAVAYHYYFIFSQEWAFALLVLTTLLMTGIAIGYDRRELAIVALAGGLVAPFLTASGEGNHIVLFSYLTILHTGMFALSLYKKWWELPVISFAATYLIMGLFVPRCFTYEASPMLPRHMLGFSTLFYLLFASAIVAVFRTRNNRFQIVLLGVITLNNFLYLLFGLTFLSGLGHNFSEGGVIPLFIAAVNAGLLWYVRRRKEQMPVLRDLLLGLTILFITLVAWCQFKEYTNTLTACWAAEAVLLTWLYLRSRIPVYEYAAAALCALTFLASAAILSAEPDGGARIFLNSACLTVLFSAAALTSGAWIIDRRRDVFTGAKVLNFPAANVLLLIAGFLLTYWALVRDIVEHLSGDLFMEALLLCTVTLLAGSLQLLRKRFPITRRPALHITGMCIAVLFFLALSTPFDNEALPVALSWISTATVIFLMTAVAVRFYRNIPGERPRRRFTILLNVLATLVWIAVFCHLLRLAGIRGSFNTGLSLALISAGTVQMALGMRRHQKLLRVFALGVFGLVILKLVTHDLWQWPTIGRIVVFILLGVVLLVLSFLYQRLKSVLFKEDN